MSRTGRIRAAARAAAVLGLVASVAWTAGCSRRSADGTMVVVDPPDGWVEALERDRAERDRLFRQSPASPLPEAQRTTFEGLDYFEPREGWYFVGDLLPDADPKRIEIPTTSGQLRPAERFGEIRFRVDGRSLKLEVYRLLDMAPGPDAFLLPFRDETTGEETYPAGRYLELNGPAGGPYVVDFNRAYNPSCAYGDVERFACPVTPPANELPIRVDVGERGFVSDEQG